MPEQQVVLEELGTTEFILVDSTMSDTKGHFELNGNAMEEGRYRVRFTGGKIILLTIEKGTVKVAADWNSIEQYTVSGSPASESFRVYLKTFRNYLNDLNTIDHARQKHICNIQYFFVRCRGHPLTANRMVAPGIGCPR